MKVKRYITHTVKQTSISGFTLADDNAMTPTEVTYTLRGNYSTRDRALNAARRNDAFFSSANEPIVSDVKLCVPTELFDTIAVDEELASCTPSIEFAIESIRKIAKAYHINLSSIQL